MSYTSLNRFNIWISRVRSKKCAIKKSFNKTVQFICTNPLKLWPEWESSSKKFYSIFTDVLIYEYKWNVPPFAPKRPIKTFTDARDENCIARIGDQRNHTTAVKYLRSSMYHRLITEPSDWERSGNNTCIVPNIL